MNGETQVDDATKLFQALPSSLSPYATSLLTAAQRAGVSPWLLAGIMQRESGGGTYLRPPGPTGAGDWTARPAGRRYASGYVVGATGMPDDALGWGRGLMQIDYAVHYDWVSKNDWKDPTTNIGFAAWLLREFMNFFSAEKQASAVMVDGWRLTNGLGPSIRPWRTKYELQSPGPYADPRPLSGYALPAAALAAYNAGSSGVLQAVSAGLPADAPTSGQDYASWIITRVNQWEMKYAELLLAK